MGYPQNSHGCKGRLATTRGSLRMHRGRRPTLPESIVPMVGRQTRHGGPLIAAATYAPPHTMPRLPDQLSRGGSRKRAAHRAVAFAASTAPWLSSSLACSACKPAPPHPQNIWQTAPREPRAGSARHGGEPPPEEAGDAPGVCAWWAGCMGCARIVYVRLGVRVQRGSSGWEGKARGGRGRGGGGGGRGTRRP
jgi:hypothetical protein